MSALNIIESIHGVSKKPRAIQQWEEISYANTQKVTQLGSSVPLAWVLVHGKNIPPNAIVAGEDKRRPLFIARTFWEGGVHIGQAGLHLERGASFAYLGREIHVDTYEVLVPLQQTITYHISHNHSISHIPRINLPNDLPVDAPILQKLRSVKIVIVIDDSMSMIGTLWSQARSALSGLISIIESDFDARGIDLCFLNNPTFETNIKDRHRIQNIFDSVVPNGGTPTGQKLQEIFNRYLPTLEDPVNGKNSPPVIVMVITDGVPSDDVVPIVVDGARRLDRNQIPLYRFGISFAQIGDDPDAAEYLRELDDDISGRHGCRDIVDATPFDPQYNEFTREVLLKCILGAIDPFYDSIRHQPQADSQKDPRPPFNSPLGLPLTMHSPAQSLLMHPMPPMPTPMTN